LFALLLKETAQIVPFIVLLMERAKQLQLV
jgi:hypothetical protein